MKLLILSTDPTILKWKTLPAKLAEIKSALKVFEVDVLYEPHTPLVSNERISSLWLNSIIKPHFNNSYDIVAFHFSKTQCTEWGIKDINGANPRTNDEMGDLYFWSDENTKRQGLSQFVQTLLHEIGHEYYAETGQKDIVHEYHAPLGKHADIIPLIKKLDWNLYQPRRMALKKTVNLLETIVGLYKRLLAIKAETATKPPAAKALQPLVKRAAFNIVAEMEKLGHPVRIVQGFRSQGEQNKLYAQGRTTAGNIVTNARGGESFHNYGLAVDFTFRKEGYNASAELWETLGVVGESQGFAWGGRWLNFPDKPHFEMTLGYTFNDFIKNKVDYNKFK
jgi:peptidoglycan L-alanyl-D-glutamate endopeptidase CwlK